MRGKSSITHYFIIIPALLLFFIFHTFPALQGAFYSLTDYQGYGNWNFVGLKNYINVFQDERVLNAYLFTLKFAIVSTILVNLISLAIALGLSSKIKFKKTLRAIYFLPYVLSVLIVGFIFNYIFSHILPRFGEFIGNEILAKNILGNPKLAWIGIVIVTVWQGLAFNTLVYMSGLVTIPETLYEAAKIDGAGTWQRFLRITLPLIVPFITINLVVSMKNYLMAYDQIMAMTGGGPGTATESVSVLIYRGGFLGGEFAYQSANSIIFFIVILLVSLLQIKLMEKREEF